MIKTKTDLSLYLLEDGKRNGIKVDKNGCPGGGYFIRLFLGYENACAYRYLRCLRHYEYHINKSTRYHCFISLFYKAKLSILGRKYNICIEPNTCGYGLRIMHLSGGGGFYLMLKK